MQTSIWVTIISSLGSGLLTFFISTYFYIHHESRKQKLEVFRKLMANRYGLVPSGDPEVNREFFRALNEAFVVFGKSKEVVKAIEGFKTRPDRGPDNVVAIARTICKDLGIDETFIKDAFFSEPFIPGCK